MVIIGDIHGCYKSLQRLLKEFPSDPICLVGDLIDRGPDSVDVVQFVIDNQDRIKCVRGNHEDMMLSYYRPSSKDIWKMGDAWLHNGGKKVYKAYKYRHPEKLKAHLDFLDELPYYLEFKNVTDQDGRYLIVSHSVIVDSDIEACVRDQSIIWGRHFPKEDPSNGKWFNVFGHTPGQQPLLNEWSCNVDTGACFGGHLTGLKFPELELVMVKNGPPEPEPSEPVEGMY